MGCNHQHWLQTGTARFRVKISSPRPVYFTSAWQKQTPDATHSTTILFQCLTSRQERESRLLFMTLQKRA